MQHTAFAVPPKECNQKKQCAFHKSIPRFPAAVYAAIFEKSE